MLCLVHHQHLVLGLERLGISPMFDLQVFDPLEARRGSVVCLLLLLPSVPSQSVRLGLSLCFSLPSKARGGIKLCFLLLPSPHPQFLRLGRSLNPSLDPDL